MDSKIVQIFKKKTEIIQIQMHLETCTNQKVDNTSSSFRRQGGKC